MFGNQQNKPAEQGLVDDLMGMSENVDDGDSANALIEKSNDSQSKSKLYQLQMSTSGQYISVVISQSCEPYNL